MKGLHHALRGLMEWLGTNARPTGGRKDKPSRFQVDGTDRSRGQAPYPRVETKFLIVFVEVGLCSG